MTDEMRNKLITAFRKDGRRIRRDVKYAHKVYMDLGIMTAKGNLTRRWQRIKKERGITLGRVEIIRRGLGLS